MFTAYFDASGHPKDQPFVIVTGYIANGMQWQALENIWKSIHKQYGVNPPFHMTEFMAATSRPDEYARQRNARTDYIALARNVEKAQSFFKNICIAQMNQINCGISSIVPMDVYDGVSELSDLAKRIPPYALGARTCVAHLHRWEEQFDIQEPVKCIFEKGDFGQTEFSSLMLEEGMEAPHLKPKAEFAGLQAADQYGWEQFHYSKKQLAGNHIPARESFKWLLNAIPKMHTVSTKEQLINLCLAKGIPIRSGANQEGGSLNGN